MDTNTALPPNNNDNNAFNTNKRIRRRFRSNAKELEGLGNPVDFLFDPKETKRKQQWVERRLALNLAQDHFPVFLNHQLLKSSIACCVASSGQVVTTHGDHTLKVFDFTTRKLLHTLQGHQNTPWSCCIHPRNDGTIVSATIHRDLIIWKDYQYFTSYVLPGGGLARNINVPIQATVKFDLLEDVLYVAFGGTIQALDISHKFPIVLFAKQRETRIRGLLVTPLNEIITIEDSATVKDGMCCTHRRVSIYYWKNLNSTANVLPRLITHQAIAFSEGGIAVSNDGKFLIGVILMGNETEKTTRNDKLCLCFIELSTSKIIKQFDLSTTMNHARFGITALAMSPTNSFVCVGYGSQLFEKDANGKSIEVVDVEEKCVLCLFSLVGDMELIASKTTREATVGVNFVCFHPFSGEGILYGTKSGEVNIIY